MTGRPQNVCQNHQHLWQIKFDHREDEPDSDVATH
jgi:hypothetical protein